MNTYLEEHLKDGAWDFTILHDEYKRSDLEAKAIINGYAIEIHCKEKTRRTTADVSLHIISPNGIVLHKEKHFYNENTSATVLNYAAEYIKEITAGITQSPQHFLEKLLLNI